MGQHAQIYFLPVCKFFDTRSGIRMNAHTIFGYNISSCSFKLEPPDKCGPPPSFAPTKFLYKNYRLEILFHKSENNNGKPKLNEKSNFNSVINLLFFRLRRDWWAAPSFLGKSPREKLKLWTHWAVLFIIFKIRVPVAGFRVKLCRTVYQTSLEVRFRFYLSFNGVDSIQR